MKKYQKLYAAGLISAETLNRVIQLQEKPVFSLHREIRMILYAGILMLSTGLGILIYQNLDSIGHQVILALITAITAGCFWYTFKNQSPYQQEKQNSTNVAADYILLFGCVSLLSLLAYLQFQYDFFGTRYGLATFIPTVILFFMAYRFDHQGVLGMAITNLALWMGVSISPQVLFGLTRINESPLIWTYVSLALLLITAAYLSEWFRIKPHFKFIYLHFGSHILHLSMLTAWFAYSGSYNWIYLLLTIFSAALLYKNGKREQSFYLILIQLFYAYIAASILYMDSLKWIHLSSDPYLFILWFIISPVLLARHIYQLHKKLKQ
ncbi:DUF2157 domain-containing protein [Pedobacter antarcticus]|uniref:DUF2157 domain-containing protein n=1 Tax=Pedobacter antarcticus TaxID=34086 RepID=UPI0008808773|nr:DUF2157 domain-containing protein [Pedobacter antarcticus]SDM76010.1 Predicted membrane protein [Pedobacter antarcticus]